MQTNWDLTTPEGCDLAGRLAGLSTAGVIAPITNPLTALRALFASPADKVEAQKKMAIELIEKGRQQGVAEMTIIVDEQAGVNLGTSVNGIPIHGGIGSRGKMEIKVKYK